MMKNMRLRLTSIFISSFLILVLLISGCGSKKNVSTTKKSTNNTKVQSVTTISDIDKWDSTVKNVLKNNNIKFVKVDLKNNNTYSIIYVEFPYNIDGDHKNNFRQLIKDIAEANGYGDFKLEDDTKAIFLEVTCDKDKKMVKEVSGGPQGYFDDLYPSQNGNTSNNQNTTPSTSNEDILTYLRKNVPEIDSLAKSLSEKSGGTVKLSIYIERKPNSASSDIHLRDYYGVYVGESHPDHSVNIYRFAVQKDNKEILYYDVAQDKYMTLAEWRNQKK